MILQQPYKIRDFDPDNLIDTERMNLMFYHPQVMKAKGYHDPSLDYGKILGLQKFDRSAYVRNLDISFAVVDTSDRLVGWIWFYSDTRHPLPKRVINEYEIDNEYHIYQISYQKLMSKGWPSKLLSQVSSASIANLHDDRPHVIVNGLSLAIDKLTKCHKKFVLYGFVLRNNIASAKVLKQNGFIKHPRTYKYDGEIHDLWVKCISR